MTVILEEKFRPTGAFNADGSPITRMNYLIECSVCSKVFWVLKGNFKEGKRCAECRNKTHEQSHTTHYKVWISMKQRCENPRTIGYSRYGAKGVKVLFTSYKEFYDWSIANGYVEGSDLTIDRRDSAGNYEPSNCRWIPASLNYSIPNRKPVNQICMDTGKILCTYLSAKFAADALGVSDASAILKVCRGKRNKAAGYKWEYA